MIRTVAAACLLAALAGPALAGAEFPPSPDSCDTLAESIADAHRLAKLYKLDVLFLDGPAAHTVIAAILSGGSKVQADAEHVAVFEDLTAGTASVYVANGNCGGFGTILPVSLADAQAAVATAQH